MATSDSKIRLTMEMDASVMSTLKQVEQALDRLHAKSRITVGMSSPGGGGAAGGPASAGMGVHRSATASTPGTQAARAINVPPPPGTQHTGAAAAVHAATGAGGGGGAGGVPGNPFAGMAGGSGPQWFFGGGLLGSAGLTMRQIGALGFAGMEASKLYASGIDLDTQRILAGRPNRMGIAGYEGGVTGMLLGGALGSMVGGPIGLAFGAGIGQTLGSSVMQRFAAEDEARRQTMTAALPAAGLLAGMYQQYGRMGHAAVPGNVSNPALTGATGFSGMVPASLDVASRLNAWAGPDTSVNGGAPAPTGFRRKLLKQLLPAFGTTEAINWVPSTADLMSGANMLIPAMIEGGLNPADIVGTNYDEVDDYVTRPVMGTKRGMTKRWVQGAARTKTLNVTGPGRYVEDRGPNSPAYFQPDGFSTGMFGMGGQPGGRLVDPDGRIKSRTRYIPGETRQVTVPDGRGPGHWEDVPYEYVTQVGTERVKTGSHMVATGGQERWQQILENVAVRYPQAIQETLAKVVPMFAGLPQTGGNLMDMLVKYGPAATHLWENANTPAGQPTPHALQELAGTYSGLLGNERSARVAGLGFRGVGSTLMSIYDSSMGMAEKIGGDKSETYLALRKQRYAAEMQSYSEQDAIQYGIPMAQLGGMRDRAQVMPFAPGYSYGLALQGMSMRSNRIGLLGSRMENLRSRGMLSEADELRFVQEREALQTANASDVAMMSQGMLDRLPALSANLPRGMSRFDSYQLAAMNLMAYGSPRRDFGAVSGRQARMQDEFVTQYAGSPMTPYGGGDAMLNSSRGIALLQEIANLLRAATGVRGGGSSNMAPTGGNPPGANNAGFN